MAPRILDDFGTTLRGRILAVLGAGGVSMGAFTGCDGSDSSNQPATGGVAGAAGTSVVSGGRGGASLGGNHSTGGTLTQTGGGGAGATGGLTTVRRPFLVGSEIRTAAAVERHDWVDRLDATDGDSALESRTRVLLAEVWLRDALEEHASIAAFARFSLMMLAHGAPADLVTAAQRASLDEVRHARACFSLACRYSGVARGPSELSLSDAITPLSLPELTALTVREGCVGETLGVLLAQAQLDHAVDPSVQRVLRRLIKDEARHSELAWGFVSFALTIGGKAVEDAAIAAFDELANAEQFIETKNYDVNLEEWHAHGRVTCSEARAVTSQALRDVIKPCREALLVVRNPSHSRGRALIGNAVTARNQHWQG